jgi:pimeloyl-ACP methyl ester carboxylesterase
MTCLREGAVSLPDGRRLGFAEYGVRGGIPLFHLHGLPGGRFYDMHPKALAAAGVWHFSVERPGFGLSDPQPGRHLLDWPSDVAAFADALGIDRFAVIGTSAGGPYALACGAEMSERVAAVGLQCAFLPVVADPELDQLLPDDWREGIQQYRTDPSGVLADDERRLQQRAARWASDPRGLFAELFGTGEDSEVFDRFRSHWMRILAATYGVTPSTDEHRVIYEPWGFDPADVEVPIHAWHGDADTSAPLALVERLLARTPHGALTVYPGEAHYLDPSHHSEMLDFLTAWATNPGRA